MSGFGSGAFGEYGFADKEQATPPGITGSIAAVESSGDSASISGAVTVSGSIAAVESSGDSASISGAVAVSGSLSATESGNDTAAITGTAERGKRIRWGVTATVGGVDVTALLYGQISVRRAVDNAAIATLSTIPAVGAVDPYSYIAADVALDYFETDAAGTHTFEQALYRGTVNQPAYDPIRRIITLTCTDRMQELFKAMTQEAIDALIPGYDSTLLYDLPESMFDYARQRVNSAPGDIITDNLGNPGYAAWAAAATPDYTYTDEWTFNDSTRVDRMADLQSMINSVTITLEHRFIWGWHRVWHCDWRIGDNAGNDYTDAEWIVDHHGSVPAKVDIQDACPYPGGNFAWDEIPATGAYTYGGTTRNFRNNDREQTLCIGARFDVMQRWTQRGVNTYTITVESAASIAQYGTNSKTMQFSVDTEDTDAEWPEDEFIAPPGTATQVHNGTDRDDYMELLTNADSAADSIEAAATCAIAEARRIILGGHHQTQLSWETILEPRIELGDTAKRDGGGTVAKGVVSAIDHTLDFARGRASTKISINLYQPNVGGQVDDAITAPANSYALPTPTAVTLPELVTHLGYNGTVEVEDPEWIGYVGNLDDVVVTIDGVSTTIDNHVFDQKFDIVIPEVPDADRLDAAIASSDSYNVAIPQDTFAFT